MEKVKIGVIGVGYLGSMHARMLARMDRVELVGVYDIVQSKAKAIADELNIRAFNSLDEILNSVEAVSVATPTTTHFEIAIEALNRNIHTFIEKPITAKISEAEQIIKVSIERNLKVQVGHIERFNPALLALKDYDLKPVFIETHRLAQFKPRGTDVAVILDLMIHDIDIILSLVKSDILEIRASGVGVVSDSLDIANARIQFNNGCVANITASRISRRKERKMRIFQKDAYISIDFLQGLAEVFRLVDEGDESVRPTVLLGQIESGKIKRKIVYEQPEVEEINQLEYELRLFIDSIIDDVTPPVTAMEAKLALDVAYRIIREIEKQQIMVREKLLI
jgi:predicted dehydrogenase